MATTLPYEQYRNALKRRHSQKERQSFRKKYDSGPKKKSGGGGSSKPKTNPFESELNAATRLEYGEQEEQLKAKQQAIPSWFDAYQQDRQAAENRVNSAFTDAQNQLQNQADTSGARDAAERKAVSTSMSEDAARRGAAISTKNEDTSAASQASRQNILGIYRDQVTANKANQTAHWAEKQRIGAGGKLSAQRSAAASMVKLGKDKGAFKTKYTADKQESLAKQQAEAAAFGLDEQKVQLDIQQEQFNQWLQKEKLGQTDFSNTTGRINATKPPASSGDGKGKDGKDKSTSTPSERRTNRKLYRQIEEWVRDNPKESDGQGKGVPSFIINHPDLFAVARHRRKPGEGKKTLKGDQRRIKDYPGVHISRKK